MTNKKQGDFHYQRRLRQKIRLVEKTAETHTSIRLASHLVRAPNSESMGSEFQSRVVTVPPSQITKTPYHKIRRAKFWISTLDPVKSPNHLVFTPWSQILHQTAWCSIPLSFTPELIVLTLLYNQQIPRGLMHVYNILVLEKKKLF